MQSAKLRRQENVTDFEKEEFWKALGRLYDSAVALQASVEGLQKVAEGHEKRLDRLDVIVQWLAEKERNREKENGG